VGLAGAVLALTRLFLSLDEMLSSSLLALSGGSDRWKDDHALRVELSRPLREVLSVRTGARVLRFWDRQSGLPNDFSRQGLYAGFDFRGSRWVFGRAEAGPAHEVRYRHHDWGARWEVTGEVRDWISGGYRQEGLLSWGGSRLGNRRNEDQRFRYLVGREFQAGAADSVQIRWDRYRRDNYINVQLDREQLVESSVHVQNRLHYRFPLGVKAFVRTEYGRDAVEVKQVTRGEPVRARKRNEASFLNTIRLTRWGQKGSGEVEIQYQTHEVRYLLPATEVRTPFSSRVSFVAPDNVSSFFGLASRLRLTPGSRDSLSVTLRSSRLQYDTPDTNNYDDHDQVRFDLAFVWKHYLGQHLKLEAHASVGLYHLVYIWGERSGDNHWNRVFRLAPAVEVRPNRALRLVQRFEVLANYVDFDYEDVLQATRSFVHRRFVAEDSLRADLDRNHRVLLVIGHELEENGRLYWDEFSERPLTGRAEWRIRLLLRRTLGRRARLDLGFGYYERLESRFQLSAGGGYPEVPLGRYIAKGPILGFTLLGRGASTVRAYVQRQHVRDLNARPYFTNFVNLVMHWEF